MGGGQDNAQGAGKGKHGFLAAGRQVKGSGQPGSIRPWAFVWWCQVGISQSCPAADCGKGEGRGQF